MYTYITDEHILFVLDSPIFSWDISLTYNSFP